jgi:hypothetical protein
VRRTREFAHCCCPDDVAATAQVVVDQLIGMATMAKELGVEWPVAWVLRVCEESGEFMQGFLDDYVKHHGAPDVQHQLAATEALLKAMGG